ncbi:MAG: tRNA pseudouridine(38-40) synthase TruA [Pirellulaceae bacterium]|nr:tRNA pseudouridine(38-40) synthase TruA [Pirellulaceae bacterium]
MSDPSTTRAFALTIAYDGTRYAGWQNQLNAISVQQRIEEAVDLAFKVRRPIVASGRTDSGVHALGQVAKLVLPDWRHAPEKIVPALNQKLPPDIAIRQAREVRTDFDPVRNASSKRYRYTVRVAACHDPLQSRFHWYRPRPLDIQSMRTAAPYLIGCHDFAAFQSLGSPRLTTVRTVREFSLETRDAMEGYDLLIDVEADGFLYNMVRNIVGSLIEIGIGRFGPRWIEDILDSKDRSRAGPTAPSQGLCLMHVEYPRGCFLEP